MSDKENPGCCPNCKDCYTFTRYISGYFDYQWDEGRKCFVQVEEEKEISALFCSKCEAFISLVDSRKAGKIILVGENEPTEDPADVRIDVTFDAEMVMEHVKDTFGFEPSLEAVKTFFNDKDKWIINYLHEAGWDLIANNAYDYFRETAVFKCRSCDKDMKYSKAEGFGQMQIERFNVMNLCEDCLKQHCGGDDD